MTVSMTHLGVSDAQLEEYFSNCDAVYELPGGFISRRGNVLHIYAPVNGLAGRKLIQSCHQALEMAHMAHDRLTCPIQHANKRAMKFVSHFGFVPFDETFTHVWFERSAK